MLGKSQIEKAAAAVESAREDVARWQAKRAAEMLELSDLEARVGEDILASGDDAEAAAGRHAVQIATLRASVDIAARTIEAAERRVRQLELRALDVEADATEVEATNIEQDADRREGRTLALLTQLREHEGVDFAPTPPAAAGGAVASGIAWTRTRAMRAEALGMRHQVALLREVAQTGLLPDFVPGYAGILASQRMTDSLRDFRTKRSVEVAATAVGREVAAP